MARRQLIECDRCPAVEECEPEEVPVGWIAVQDAKLDLHFCSHRCVEEWAWMVNQERDTRAEFDGPVIGVG